jgi:hypothetical protein
MGRVRCDPRAKTHGKRPPDAQRWFARFIGVVQEPIDRPARRSCMTRVSSAFFRSFLTDLLDGQEVTVLQLPAQPKTSAEEAAQRRVTYVG